MGGKSATRKAAQSKGKRPSVPATIPARDSISDAERKLAGQVLDTLSEGVRAPAVNVQLSEGKHLIGLQGDDGAGHIRLVGAMGTRSDAFGLWALGALTAGVATKPDDADDTARAINAALAAIHGMKARDEVEAMLMSQMVACHQQAMLAFGNMRVLRDTEMLRAKTTAANAFMRTYAAQMEALKRYRSRGVQTVRVERVYVGPGGQAIVGNVNRRHGERGGSVEESYGQPDEQRQIERPSETPLPSALKTNGAAVPERSH